MGQKIQEKASRRRKWITLLWIAALAILTISLIYWEQTALLYILATLGVTALLVVVAVADIGRTGSNSSTTAGAGAARGGENLAS
jgi:predicted lysophospholipase L1 biosynthesis ABC-type transport system permease subunit